MSRSGELKTRISARIIRRIPVESSDDIAGELFSKLRRDLLKSVNHSDKRPAKGVFPRKTPRSGVEVEKIRKLSICINFSPLKCRPCEQPVVLHRPRLLFARPLNNVDESATLIANNDKEPNIDQLPDNITTETRSPAQWIRDC